MQSHCIITLKLASLLLAALHFSSLCKAQDATETATIFAVINPNLDNSAATPTASNFQTISAVGVGADGATTYVGEERISLVLKEINATTTINGVATVTPTIETVTIPTHTNTFTIIADASNLRVNEPANPTSISGIGNFDDVTGIQTCVLDANGGTGSCVVQVFEVGGPTTSTAVATFTGPLTPAFTVTTDTKNLNKHNNGALRSYPAWRAFGCGLLLVAVSYL